MDCSPTTQWISTQWIADVCPYVLLVEIRISKVKTVILLYDPFLLMTYGFRIPFLFFWFHELSPSATWPSSPSSFQKDHAAPRFRWNHTTAQRGQEGEGGEKTAAMRTNTFLGSFFFNFSIPMTDPWCWYIC